MGINRVVASCMLALGIASCSSPYELRPYMGKEDLTLRSGTITRKHIEDSITLIQSLNISDELRADMIAKAETAVGKKYHVIWRMDHKTGTQQIEIYDGVDKIIFEDDMQDGYMLEGKDPQPDRIFKNGQPAKMYPELFNRIYKPSLPAIHADLNKIRNP